ncbi:MAG: hypothetical protein LBD64_02840 [Odoribacteraceae bacterium]|nr:hypothetical protein [Odoribacteraceae bacterium]
MKNGKARGKPLALFYSCPPGVHVYRRDFEIESSLVQLDFSLLSRGGTSTDAAFTLHVYSTGARAGIDLDNFEIVIVPNGLSRRDFKRFITVVPGGTAVFLPASFLVQVI